MKKLSKFELSRRKFVAGGSTVAAVVGFGGFSRMAMADYISATQQQSAGLSIAYLQGSEKWDYLHGLTPAQDMTFTETAAVDEALLIGANVLASGDAGFLGRGARVTIHGMIAEPSRQLPPMLLKAHYTPHHDVAHLAWGFEGTTACMQPGTSFTVPVDSTNGLQLSLEMQSNNSNSASENPLVAEAHLVLGGASGMPKLRRGVYLLDWNLSGESTVVAWTGRRVVAEQIDTPEEGLSAIRRFMVTDASGVAKVIPGLMMTVDYDDDLPS